MNADFAGEDFLYNSGLPDYAVTNNIILIFPQAKLLDDIWWSKNRYGLWAYSPEANVGLSEKDTFNTMYSPQAKQLKGMVDRVIEPLNAEEYTYKNDWYDLLERWGITIFLDWFTTRMSLTWDFLKYVIPYKILTDG